MKKHSQIHLTHAETREWDYGARQEIRYRAFWSGTPADIIDSDGLVIETVWGWRAGGAA